MQPKCFLWRRGSDFHSRQGNDPMCGRSCSSPACKTSRDVSPQGATLLSPQASEGQGWVRRDNPGGLCATNSPWERGISQRELCSGVVLLGEKAQDKHWVGSNKTFWGLPKCGFLENAKMLHFNCKYLSGVVWCAQDF